MFEHSGPAERNCANLLHLLERKTKYIRDRPFNLQGGGGGGSGGFYGGFFVQKNFSDNTRDRIFVFLNLTLGYMTKTLNQIIFFSPPKSEYFFQQHWQSEYLFRKKNTPPPPPRWLNGPSLIRELCT